MMFKRGGAARREEIQPFYRVTLLRPTVHSYRFDTATKPPIKKESHYTRSRSRVDEEWQFEQVRAFVRSR
jgi:hypothetical protein